MSGFEVNPVPGRKPTIGEQIDLLIELDEQTFDALCARLTRLERAVAVLEGLVAG